MKTIVLQPDIKLTIRTLKFDKTRTSGSNLLQKTVQMGTIFPFETTEKRLLNGQKMPSKLISIYSPHQIFPKTRVT